MLWCFAKPDVYFLRILEDISHYGDLSSLFDVIMLIDAKRIDPNSTYFRIMSKLSQGTKETICD